MSGPGIEPDIMAVAKGIGGGFPLGACLAKGEVAKSMVPGTHGSTYGGNPLACAIGNAVLDRVLSPASSPMSKGWAQRLAWHLQQLQQRFPQFVVELRGKGLLAGIKITPPVRDFVLRLRDDPAHAGPGRGRQRAAPPAAAGRHRGRYRRASAEKIAAAFEAIAAETAGRCKLPRRGRRCACPSNLRRGLMTAPRGIFSISTISTRPPCAACSTRPVS
jgi:acetylornithine/N-succinyldiaminopimelate aminotransferase